jgi:hypothetical protein
VAAQCFCFNDGAQDGLGAIVILQTKNWSKNLSKVFFCVSSWWNQFSKVRLFNG